MNSSRWVLRRHHEGLPAPRRRSARSAAARLAAGRDMSRAARVEPGLQRARAAAGRCGRRPEPAAAPCSVSVTVTVTVTVSSPGLAARRAVAARGAAVRRVRVAGAAGFNKHLAGSASSTG
jgi:hypothetical protein